MNLQRKVIGAHAYFFLDGAAYTVPDNGTADRTHKPGAADPKWIDLGEGDHAIAPNSKEEEFMAPSPGMRVLKDIITTARGLKIKSKLMEMQNLSYQMLLGTAELPTSPTAGGQYNPLEGNHRVKGWLKLQQYGEDNQILNTLDVYVSGKISGDVGFGDKPVDVDIEWDVLFSTLNTGTLA
ncbi:MAG: hypothetical protein KF715_08640 [Candidatus Didemnitutus sp.]|nr:hypothetical protein [Candidatus Didemnitutus sp.]